jgi:hypothetical protein
MRMVWVEMEALVVVLAHITMLEVPQHQDKEMMEVTLLLLMVMVLVVVVQEPQEAMQTLAIRELVEAVRLQAQRVQH